MKTSEGVPKWAFDPLWKSILKKRVHINGWNRMTWDELVSEATALNRFYGWTSLEIAQSFKKDNGHGYIPREIEEKHLTDIEAAIQIGKLIGDDTP